MPMTDEELLRQFEEAGLDDAPEELPFIGVPQDWTVRGTPSEDARAFAGRYLHTDRAPLYRQGDEFLPAKLSAEDRARVQRAMLDAGLLRPGDEFQLGAWDTTTRRAFTELLTFANEGAMEWRDALAEYQRLHDEHKQERKKLRPQVVSLTNPADIESAGDRIAREVLGRKLDDRERASLIAGFQAAEQSYQQAAYDAEIEGYGTVVKPPDSLESMVRAASPVEAGARDIADTGNEFFGLLDEARL